MMIKLWNDGWTLQLVKIRNGGQTVSLLLH